jgi:hypothetical protein
MKCECHEVKAAECGGDRVADPLSDPHLIEDVSAILRIASSFCLTRSPRRASWVPLFPAGTTFPYSFFVQRSQAVSGQAFAQDTQAPAHAAVVDGTVVLDREDGSTPLTRGTPFVPGDRVRTANGRAEFLFPDGSALDLDEYTTIELKSETLLALTSGRVFLTVTGALDPGRAVRYHIDGPAASLQTESAGEYRLRITDPGSGDMELAVLRGSASFYGDTGSMLVRAGELSVARSGYAPSSPQYLNSARMDDFDRWAADRRNERLGSMASNQYLPSDLRSYGATFAQYGSWNYENSYGYVWYPTVAVGWRPYYNGYWSSVPSYGWTWIGGDPWGWPTHHYGRWGYGHSRWFWIPDRRYSPAYVSWASAPGYVGWCPLGYDNRPVFGLSASVGNTWVGWTVLPQQQFGARGVYVNTAALAPRQIPAAHFVSHVAAPYPPPRVPHARTEPAVTAGAAVPRSWSNPPSTLNSPSASESSTWYGTGQSGGVRPPIGSRRPNPTPPGQAVAAPFIPSTAPRTLGMPRSPSSTGFSTATPGTIQASPGTSRAVARPALPGQNPAWGPSSAAPATPPSAAPPTRGPAPTSPVRSGWGAAPPTSSAAAPTWGTASPTSGAASPTGGSLGLRAIPRSAPPPAAPSTAGHSSAGATPSSPASGVVRSGTSTPARPAGAPASAAPPATASGQSQASSAAPPAGARTSHRSR